MKNWKLCTIFCLAIVAYCASLFLPGIVYKPSVLRNEKYLNTDCDLVLHNPDLICKLGPNGPQFDPQSCYYTRTDLKPKNPPFPPEQASSKEEIATWCAGYNTPVISSDSGRAILEIGWIGILTLNIAWYANLVGFFALVSLLIKSYKKGRTLALVSFLIGLESYLFTTYPLDEGGANVLTVDHLGIGFYVWELAFLLLALYCYLKTKTSSNTRKQKS